MRTFPDNASGAALHDYPVDCDICQAKWYRSQMRLDEDGILKCPFHRGADAQELARLNAELSEPYSLHLDRDQGTVQEGPYSGNSGLLDTLWEEAFGQSRTDPL